MEKEISNVEMVSKKNFKLPEGAEIIKKRYNLTVREIENGFIVVKDCSIDYRINDRNEYEHFSKEWYSKKNPIKIEGEEKNKYISDSF